MPPTDSELVEIVARAERYNGAGRDTVLLLVAEIQRLRRELLLEKTRPFHRIQGRVEREEEGR